MGERKEALEAAKESARETLLDSIRYAGIAIGAVSGLVSILSGVVSALGFGLGLVGGVLVAVITGLLTVVGSLGVWVREYRREAEKRNEELERKLEEANDDGVHRTFLGYAYSIFMHENAVSQDKQHLYTYQEWTFDLTGNDLEYQTVLQGKVWDTSESDSIDIKLFGEVESNVDDMGFAAYQREPLQSGQDEADLEPKVVGSSKTTEAVIEIPFDDECRPIDHKGTFEVCYEVEPLGEEDQNNDIFRHVPAHRFQINGDVTIHMQTGGQVEDIEATMAKVSENKLFRSPGEIVAEDIDLTPIPGVDEEGGIEYNKDEKRYQYTCEDCHKALFLFRIRY